MELSEIRAEIDGLNRSLLGLFERRMALCGQVAAYKKEHGMEIFVPEREEAILNRVRETADPALAEYDLRFFACLLEESRKYQARLIGEDGEPKEE